VRARRHRVGHSKAPSVDAILRLDEGQRGLYSGAVVMFSEVHTGSQVRGDVREADDAGAVSGPSSGPTMTD